ncbi:type II toxin-antitoxin system RnlA family toxin [Desulfovibrio litoralis]|uniref:Bacterial toxin RNase RnlA/LsoA N-terminal repeated domain-containing protein n=1 Tax=Desulfovibrio litoralis DSM 11393 TaxID=1121455 RepID=A0A1M7S085_9BACT|nr:type II toxin-antitoxin system RnlA family toxin [Desulfovibrio litoralis]SHN51905.1 hypothetical protein SAMN02745728_00395 [Desulfovibrio litoralis DSM 11393]
MKKNPIKMPFKKVLKSLDDSNIKYTQERNKDQTGTIIRLKTKKISSVTITTYDNGTLLIQSKNTTAYNFVKDCLLYSNKGLLS